MFGVKGEGSRGVTCQSHGKDVDVLIFPPRLALSAEVVAFLGKAEERDALAPWVSMA